MGLISISELSARAHICSVYQLVEVAVCHLHLTAPPLIDCMLVTAVSLAGSPLTIAGRVEWAILHWNPYNFEKVATMSSLSNRPSHRLGLLVAVVSPAGSPVAIAGRVV